MTAVLAGCTGGAGTASPTQPPPATVTPDDPVSAGPGAGNGGGLPGDPGAGQPAMVTPVAGLLQLREVGAHRLTAAVDGRSVAVRVEWWSGVEPCSVLAGVDVGRDGNVFRLTVREGTADPNAACIEIAVLKGTIVELGELEPGEYVIRAMGDAPAITVTVG